MLNKIRRLQEISIVAAILILLSVPSYPLFVEAAIEIAIFSLLVILTIRYYTANLKIYAFLAFILTAIYSPISWLIAENDFPATLDVIAAIITFLISLSLDNLIVHEESFDAKLAPDSKN